MEVGQWLRQVKIYLVLTNTAVDRWVDITFTFLSDNAFTLWSGHPANVAGCTWEEFLVALCTNHGDAHVAQDARAQLKVLVLPKFADAKAVQTMGRHFQSLLAKVRTNPSMTGLVIAVGPVEEYEYWIDMLARSGAAGHAVIALLGTQFQTVMNKGIEALIL